MTHISLLGEYPKEWEHILHVEDKDNKSDINVYINKNTGVVDLEVIDTNLDAKLFRLELTDVANLITKITDIQNKI